MENAIPLQMQDLFRLLVDTVQHHLPQAASWLPTAGVGAVALFGLILLVRGAKLASTVAAISFFAIGGAAGGAIATNFALPYWPAAVLSGILGSIVALLFFRFWMALLLAGSLAAAGWSVYYVQVLTPHVATYTSNGFDTQAQLVSLPDASAQPQSPAISAELRSLWMHLSANVPNFQTNAAAILLATIVAGLALGLLLPWAARSVWAASAGTLLLMASVMMLLQQFWPAAAEWLISLGPWGWTIVGGVWLISLVVNLVSGKRRTAQRDEPDDAAGEPAPA